MAWNPPTGASAGGTGDVTGPASATDENIAVYDGTTGKLIKDGGAAIADLVADSEWTAKGDLVGASAASTPSALNVGANDTMLMADSGEATGLKWAAKATVLTALNVEDGADVTDATNVDAAGAVMETDFAAKGDLLSASAVGTLEILSVGADGRVLVADSGEASGLSWNDAAGLDYTAIHDDTASEISVVTAKAVPTLSDYLLIEDAGAADAKKSITIGDIPTFGGDSGAGGTVGFVPAPAAGDAAASKYLMADGTWTAPSGGVSGPATSTDGALALWDGAGGGTLKDSGIVVTSGTYSSAEYENFAAQGTNESINLQPSGTGAFYLGPPADGTATGGNNRGSYAVDLGMTHFFGLSVASGNYSFNVGNGNKATGNYSMTMGYSASSAGEASLAGGYSPNTSGARCLAWGSGAAHTGGYGASFGGSTSIAGMYSCGYGFYSQAPGQYSMGGGYRGYAPRDGEIATACSAGQTTYPQNDHMTIGMIPISRITTDGTAAQNLYNRFNTITGVALQAKSAMTFHILVNAMRTDAVDETAGYEFVGVIDNQAGTTALVGTVTKNVIAEDTTAWDCDVVADDTNDCLQVQVTGEAGKTIRWTAQVMYAENKHNS